jgi:hypothetical protein
MVQHHKKEPLLNQDPMLLLLFLKSKSEPNYNTMALIRALAKP